MAQIALPRHQATLSQSGGVGSPLYQRRQSSNAGIVELLPNPDFSFPMRGPDTSSESTSTNPRPMSLQAYPTGRRGSTPHQRQKSVSALPAFSFNPAAASQPSVGTSPPQSPTDLQATLARPIGGHRRGGSEFIGGGAAGTSLLSTSPTKGDNVLPPPSNALRPGPPAGRRGHAHRRSGAVSSHDLTSIMNPPAAKTGSAPSTPSEANEFTFGHKFNRSISQPSLRTSTIDDEEERPPSRARVGFSDRVEYIRPLSTISSETETSLSTIRGHSATNSLSSIVGGTSSPQPARTRRTSLSTVEDEGRPSTAGAVLDKFMSASLTGAPSDRKRPMSAISPASPTATSSSTRVSVKKRGFFYFDSSKKSDNSTHTLPTSRSDPALSQYAKSPLPSPAVDDESMDDAETPKSSSRKAGRKPRKVKSWANSIMPRKGRHSKKPKTSPHTPAAAMPDVEDSDSSEDFDFEPNFDEDTTVTIVSPTKSSTPAPKIDTDYASWQPRALKRVDSDIMSPIIDLDAALGPFNTPNGSSPRTQQRGFSAHRRAMHSAGGLPASHRRTESAPELVPFDMRSSTVASTSPMADVFEEEEPEEDPVMLRKDSQPVSVAEEKDEEPKIDKVEADVKNEGRGIKWNFGGGLGIDRSHLASNARAEEPVSPHTVPHSSNSPAPQEMEPVEVVEDYEEPRASSLTHSSDSTVTPQLTGEDHKEHHIPMNTSLPLPQQSLMTPNTVASSFSSPDYRSSQASFETPRVGTAASSVVDYPTMPSPRFGEPGPELRISVDDVPSLTSSRSTMTSNMQNPYALPSPRRLGDRSASLSSDPSDLETRRRKRSSIASFSRLMNSSSHGEKSKLSIEQRPQSSYLQQPKDKKKHNRLSKLMFWKTKDFSSSSHAQA